MTYAAKIKDVMRQAKCSAHEAAEALGIDIDAATMAEIANSEGMFTLEKILGDGKVKAARVLVDIIEDPAAEYKDRIAAAKIILVGAGELPQIGTNGYEDRMKKFLQVAESYQEKNANVIDVRDMNNEKHLAVAI